MVGLRLGGVDGVAGGAPHTHAIFVVIYDNLGGVSGQMHLPQIMKIMETERRLCDCGYRRNDIESIRIRSPGHLSILYPHLPIRKVTRITAR